MDRGMFAKQNAHQRGLAAAIGCMLLWGVLPAYWRALIPISSGMIILYRFFLAFLSALLMSMRSHSLAEIFGIVHTDRKMFLRCILAGVIITVNWSLFIWAVNADHVIDCSIGYYIEPLMICMFGILFFKEKLTVYKGIALTFAATSVVILLVHFHRLPWIPLGLAVTFSVYSAIKKTVTVPPLVSLVYETVFQAPLALAAILWFECSGKGALVQGAPYQFVLLMLCGFLTAVPMGLFAAAAQKVTMFELGLVEYISPTITMLMGIFLFREPTDGVQMLAIGLIWIGLVFFSFGEYKESKKQIPA